MLKHVLGTIHDLMVFKDELWLVVRKKHLEYLFQPRLNRLKDIIPPDVYHEIVMNLKVGDVSKAHELVHAALDNTLHSFGPKLRRDWDELVDALDGIDALERRFYKFGPVFD